jgi:predicted HicB family RNase H-like nuclease
MSERYDGFTVGLFRDDAGDWVAHFNELPEISAFGPSPEAALQELGAAWEAVKQVHREEGTPIPLAPARKQYSGQFNVRIGKHLHRALAIEAAQAGITLNALVAQKLSQAAGIR